MEDKTWFDRMLEENLKNPVFAKAYYKAKEDIQKKQKALNMNPSWVERFLLKLFDHYDIKGRNSEKDETYLRRFFIFRSKYFKIYLHKVMRSDSDADPHDHPWRWLTMVLKGGYNDERWITSIHPFRHGFYRRFDGLEKMTPGSIRLREASHLHRLRLIDETKPTWTLVGIGPKIREWGFVKEDGWVYWRDYLGEYEEAQGE